MVWQGSYHSLANHCMSDWRAMPVQCGPCLYSAVHASTMRLRVCPIWSHASAVRSMPLQCGRVYCVLRTYLCSAVEGVLYVHAYTWFNLDVFILLSFFPWSVWRWLFSQNHLWIFFPDLKTVAADWCSSCGRRGRRRNISLKLLCFAAYQPKSLWKMPKSIPNKN